MLPSLRKQRKSWVFAPEFPLFIIYKVNARDASGVILYIAYFTSESTTIATRQLSDYEIHQSSIFRECLSFRDVYASLEILSCFYFCMRVCWMVVMLICHLIYKWVTFILLIFSFSHTGMNHLSIGGRISNFTSIFMNLIYLFS